MSEVAIFRDKNAVLPTIRRGELDDMTKNLMGGGGNNKRISIRGGIFRMIVDGQEVAKNEERHMDVVLVAAAPKTSRQYYAGTYQEGNISLPDCWSNDGERPDARSTSPQSSACVNCPMNVAGSGQGSSKACRYNHRLAVLLGNDIENSDVYQLVLPAQSIFGKGDNGKMPLMQYAKFLGGNGLTMNSVVTEMRFDTSSATPKLTFRAVRPLDMDVEYPIAVEKGSSSEAIAAISFNPAQVDKGQARVAADPAPTEVFRDVPARAAKAAKAPEVVEEAETVDEPVVREKKSAGPAPKGLDDVLAAWGDDD